MTDDEREFSERVVDHAVAAYAAAYAKEGDRFAVWEAIEACRSIERPLPAWVLDYLGRVARQMNRIARTVAPWNGPEPRSFAAAVLEALELKRRGRGRSTGPGTALTRLRNAWRNRRLVEGVIDRIAREGTKPYLAFEEEAKLWGVSKETVRRAWKETANKRQRVAEERQLFEDAKRAEGRVKS